MTEGKFRKNLAGPAILESGRLRHPSPKGSSPRKKSARTANSTSGAPCYLASRLLASPGTSGPFYFCGQSTLRHILLYAVLSESMCSRTCLLAPSHIWFQGTQMRAFFDFFTDALVICALSNRPAQPTSARFRNISSFPVFNPRRRPLRNHLYSRVNRMRHLGVKAEEGAQRKPYAICTTRI